MSKSVSLTIFVALILFWLLFQMISYLYHAYQVSHYKSYIPASLEVKDSVIVGSRRGGFIEGCGVAIFKLTEEVLEEIKAEGLDYLDRHLIPRKDQELLTRANGQYLKSYRKWRKTPFSPGDIGSYPIISKVARKDLGGKTCVDMPRELKESILSEIDDTFSFYTKIEKHNELIVIPKLSLVIFSHDR